jgi:hypothetical protein
MEKHNLTATIIRWTARISGSLILAFGLFFILANVFGNDESGEGIRNAKELISFLMFPISPVIGLSIAWKWEGLGGIITTAGMVGLFIIRPDLLSSLYMGIPIIPGLLYITYWLMTKNKEG